MLHDMDKKITFRIGQFLLRIGSIAFGLILALISTFLKLLADSEPEKQDDDKLGSSIRGGVLNFRTGEFDDGTDPAGIYKLH